GFAEEHPDDLSHGRFHVNDKNLLIIPNEERTSTVGRQNSTNLHRHDIILHTHSLWLKFEKTSLQTRGSRDEVPVPIVAARDDFPERGWVRSTSRAPFGLRLFEARRSMR